MYVEVNHQTCVDKATLTVKLIESSLLILEI